MLFLLSPIWIPALILLWRHEKKKRSGYYLPHHAASLPQPAGYCRAGVAGKRTGTLRTGIDLVSTVYRYFKIYPKTKIITARRLTSLVANSLNDPFLHIPNSTVTRYFAGVGKSGKMPFAEFVKGKGDSWYLKRNDVELPEWSVGNGGGEFDFSWQVRNHVSKTNTLIRKYFESSYGKKEITLDEVSEYICNVMKTGNTAFVKRWLKHLQRCGEIAADYVVIASGEKIMPTSAYLEKYGAYSLQTYHGIVKDDRKQKAGLEQYALELERHAAWKRRRADSYAEGQMRLRMEREEREGRRAEKNQPAPQPVRNSNVYQPGTEYYYTERMETPGTPEYMEMLERDTWIGEETISGEDLKALTGNDKVDTRKEYDVIDAIDNYDLDPFDY